MEILCDVCNEILPHGEDHNKTLFLGLEIYACDKCINKEDNQGDINPNIEYSNITGD